MTEDDNADYWELGFQLHSREPELILAKVWWRAGELHLRAEDAYNFVFGYSAARRQKDDYEREQQHGSRTDQAASRTDPAEIGAG